MLIKSVSEYVKESLETLNARKYDRILHKLCVFSYGNKSNKIVTD